MLIIQGTISCGLSSVDLEYPVHVMNRIPLDSTFSATIHPTEPTSLTVPIESFGTGEQRLSVTLDGPLSRVASGPDDVVVKEDGFVHVEHRTIGPSDQQHAGVRLDCIDER